MHINARKAVTTTLALAATAALSLGISSEAWGSSAWDKAPATARSSAWDSHSSAWDAHSSAWDSHSSAWD